MGKRIVSVTIERHYTKQATIEVEVDDSIVGEELLEFLTHDEKIDDLLENALAEDSLSADDTNGLATTGVQTRSHIQTDALQHIMAVEWKLSSSTQTFRFLLLHPQKGSLTVSSRIACCFRSRFSQFYYW
jgi:hypothetical protein